MMEKSVYKTVSEPQAAGGVRDVARVHLSGLLPDFGVRRDPDARCPGLVEVDGAASTGCRAPSVPLGGEADSWDSRGVYLVAYDDFTHGPFQIPQLFEQAARDGMAELGGDAIIRLHVNRALKRSRLSMTLVSTVEDSGDGGEDCYESCGDLDLETGQYSFKPFPIPELLLGGVVETMADLEGEGTVRRQVNRATKSSRHIVTLEFPCEGVA
jgi:hypothetical protein